MIDNVNKDDERVRYKICLIGSKDQPNEDDIK
jgi:hypothetical protein